MPLVELRYYDEIEDKWLKLEGKSNAIKVILYGINAEGEPEALLCEDGKLITTTGAE